MKPALSGVPVTTVREGEEEMLLILNNNHNIADETRRVASTRGQYLLLLDENPSPDGNIISAMQDNQELLVVVDDAEHQNFVGLVRKPCSAQTPFSERVKTKTEVVDGIETIELLSSDDEEDNDSGRGRMKEGIEVGQENVVQLVSSEDEEVHIAESSLEDSKPNPEETEFVGANVTVGLSDDKPPGPGPLGILNVRKPPSKPRSKKSRKKDELAEVDDEALQLLIQRIKVANKKAIKEAEANNEPGLQAPFQPKEIPCSYCDFSSYIADDVKRHILTVHGINGMYSCPNCEFNTNDSAVLGAHIVANHKVERRYRCPHCTLITTTSSNLKRHMNALHTSEERKASKCSICGLQTKDKKALEIHMKAKHMVRVVTPPLRKAEKKAKEQLEMFEVMPKHAMMRYCSFCDFETPLSKTLTAHLWEEHNKRTVFPCPYCDFMTDHLSVFKKHLWMLHRSY